MHELGISSSKPTFQGHGMFTIWDKPSIYHLVTIYIYIYIYLYHLSTSDLDFAGPSTVSMFPVFFLSEGKFEATARSSQEHVEPKFGAENSQDTGPKCHSRLALRNVCQGIDFINIFYEHISYINVFGIWKM